MKLYDKKSRVVAWGCCCLPSDVQTNKRLFTPQSDIFLSVYEQINNADIKRPIYKPSLLTNLKAAYLLY